MSLTFMVLLLMTVTLNRELDISFRRVIRLLLGTLNKLDLSSLSDIPLNSRLTNSVVHICFRPVTFPYAIYVAYFITRRLHVSSDEAPYIAVVLNRAVNSIKNKAIFFFMGFNVFWVGC